MADMVFLNFSVKFLFFITFFWILKIKSSIYLYNVYNYKVNNWHLFCKVNGKNIHSTFTYILIGILIL